MQVYLDLDLAGDWHEFRLRAVICEKAAIVAAIKAKLTIGSVGYHLKMSVVNLEAMVSLYQKDPRQQFGAIQTSQAMEFGLQIDLNSIVL